MSKSYASTGQNLPTTAYLVAAPARSDIISSALRSAYPQAHAATDPFSDILAALDTIDLQKVRR
ncbi:hypothetical protein GCM10008023_12240 [Sphingomonas glacialis]|uniref:Uncharacterized protein n=1 Tax=Sphingomonas glacialis TaxID=658225 RepID=A0ABQ3LDV0_9SPHN|nr:hypothetical protein [Sphingomonas glacialis]GHH12279.1 hypothetical protein GCM10008023_12240 [Sphingomonas glacialis]